MNPEDLDNVSAKIDHVSILAVALAFNNYLMLQDLKICLLKSVTEEKFITSDNPVVLYNQLFEGVGGFPKTALGQKGLQIFIPISPRMVILFYDSSTYESRFKKNGSVPLGAADVRCVNKLQWASALENIYFRAEEAPDADFPSDVSSLRRENLTRKNEMEASDKRARLVITSRNDIEIGLRLNFLKVRKEAVNWVEVNRRKVSRLPVLYRSKELERLDRELRDDFHRMMHD
ncbi:hypothetical protein BH688_07600 [Kushneria phosphatilytica]|nr:hypothetical protein BH688_07600 [Kushneria phosphatilytica]